ncbi:MAG TPA: ABC transporter permease [Candidatus Methylacidiphilales bacterium]|nr:ABC transporter permease [Candidatus Methylacidiphilales bacterium]
MSGFASVTAMLGLVRSIGGNFLGFLESAGEIVFLFTDTMRCLTRYRWRFKHIIAQIHRVGVSSIVVIVTTGSFTGAVFATQMQYQFGPLGMNSAVGPVVAVSMFRELGPVLAALMVAGRVGSSLAAELATMKITEQLDALRALAVYPTEYLIAPRVIALLISMPVLVSLTIGCGIMAGYYVAVPVLEVDGTYYWANTLKFTSLSDVLTGLIKGIIFGFIIALISCHKGLSTSAGAEGVGRATTEAVVNSSMVVLISNFFISFLLNLILPAD